VVGFLIRRTGQPVIVLVIVTAVTLGIVHLFPGGPVKALLGPRATPDQVAYYTHLCGFDQPFYVQYIKWIGQLLHGNFGFSDKLNQSVVSLIGLSLPTLVAGAIFIEVVFNYPGLGPAFYQAALNVDYQVLLGFTVLGPCAGRQAAHRSLAGG